MSTINALTMGDDILARTFSDNNRKAIAAWNDLLNTFRPQDKTGSTKLNVFAVDDSGGRPDPTAGPNAPVPGPEGSDKDMLPIPTDFTHSWTKLTNGTSSDQK